MLTGLLAFLLLGTLLSACSRPRPNILLVSFDTTRWDRMGYATGRPHRTPMLDAIAARGTWFSTAVTAQPLTLPSHTSILSGVYPYHHGVRNNGTYIVPESTELLSERLKAIGYQTHAVVSAFVLDSQFGMDQGFDSYDDDLSGGPRQKMFMFKEVKADQTTRRAAEWLRTSRKPDQPFFLFVHYFDPHADYEPPPEFAARFPGDPYSAEIAFADQEFGRLIRELESLKQLENTLIVFTSDHGDGLGEHGERSHGLFIYDSTTRVPLIMAGPGVPAGGRVDQVVRTVDIVPTLLELLELPGSDTLDGESLVPLWKGRPDARAAYVENIMTRENFGWAELRGLRSSALKVIQAPRPEVYALQTDPGERFNLLDLGGPPPEAADLRSELERLEAADPLRSSPQTGNTLDAETRRKLSALGYVWDAPPPTSGENLPDPKERAVYWEEFQASQQLVRAKKLPEAQASLQRLLQADPDNVIALGSLAGILKQMGHQDEALQIYSRMRTLDPRRETAYLGPARILMEQRRYEEARAMIQSALELQPDNPEGSTAMGDLYLERQQLEDAEIWFRKALALDPHSPLAIGGLGNCLNRANKLTEAASVLGDAYRRDNTSQTITYNLAVVTERLGDARAALEIYKHAIRLEPDHSMSWNNLGSLMNKAGKSDDALKLIRKAVELDENNVEAIYNLGALLITSGKPAEALPYLDRALVLRPDLLQAALMRSRALETLGRIDEARTSWTALTPKFAPAYLSLARLELRVGNTAAARAALAQGLSSGGPPFRAAVHKDESLKPLLEGL